MTVERLCVEMPLDEFLVWREMYRAEDDARRAEAEKTRR